MPDLFDRLDKKKAKDIKVLYNFISIFCRHKHQELAKAPFEPKDARLSHALDHRKGALCQDCNKLLNHAITKRLLCPYDPKPVCRKCRTHCYAPGYREQIRKVMSFSGIYLVKHGRLDLLVHYLK